ncbi:MAG: hypothetical protein J6P61_10270 [Erysipelotrichaceae bacterium]|nr:hypothetical protein [Erysipelotrichaceae bacterium]
MGSVIFGVIIVAVFYYFAHPSLNITHPFSAMCFLGLLILIYLIINNFYDDARMRGDSAAIARWRAITSIATRILIGVVLLGGALFVGTTKIFHAHRYANRIAVEQVEFNNETLSEVDFNKTPIIDRDSTQQLGDKVMGEMPELVSQFEVSSEYTQISYKNKVYRVTPLEYAGFIKYLNNKAEGIPAYILVDSSTGKTTLVKLKDIGLSGMKYVPSALFNHNLERKLQFDYPTAIFGNPSFEIDEEGHPWYVCTTYGYFGIANKRYVTGMILFDPITGASTKYKLGEYPEWVDRVYPEDLILTEIDDNGSLQKGFINSIFGQKNVMITSDGYNYLEKDGDIWIYSGITSANSDSSNLGFVLSNLRTHETLKFSCSGANEYSAMSSAEGEVKNYGYESTFPLLINVGGNPVYLLSLKDDGGLVKNYAMVDAKDYQQVSVITADSLKSLAQLKKNFLLSKTGDDSAGAETVEAKITVKSKTILNVEGVSKVFIVDTNNKKYKVEVTSSNEDALAFLSKGDTITVQYVAYDDVNIIKSIE